MKNLKQALADYLLKPETLANRALPVKFLETVQARTQPPAGDSYYGSKASGYNAGRDRQPWWVEENRLVEVIVETLPPLSNVLDVPCGTGRFFDFFASKGIAVTGLDSSSDMLAEAAILSSQLRENFVPDLHEGSAVALPFADSSFELVVCVRFLRSIISFGEAKKVIREIGRVASRWALLELDVRPPEKKRRAFPSDRLAMRDGLYLDEIRQLLAQSDLRLISSHEIQAKQTNRFIILAEKNASKGL